LVSTIPAKRVLDAKENSTNIPVHLPLI